MLEFLYLLFKIATDIRSDDPEKRNRGMSGLQGAAVGAVIGTTLVPGAGTVIGGAVGAAVGWVSSWFRS